ncbi:DUF6588 family protein [Robertkochia sediminum]|uniref:DUF6588 family protein n=1 Tax=Robertkochia sediminum TaxID=2785326 RepID=UPI0019334F40|nr:DUF6588 family protein [Robertkochia sediminum]MBL7472600.1 hypothetical protein [Robertkochia sediminum]
MKKILLICFLGLTSLLQAQNDFDVILAAGVDDAERFANDYLAPGTNGLMYSMNNGWFNTADVKPFLGFEISVIGNGALIKDSHREFTMNVADYENITFSDGSASKMVATALGENDTPIDVVLTYDDPIFGDQTVEVTLPNGIGDASKFIPSAFIQAAVGLVKGTELKVRFVPEVTFDEVTTQLYGVGLQHEFTKWLPADKLLPVAISGLVAYTSLNGSYDFTASSGIEGENQRLENNTSTWLFQGIVSTKLPVINFYGALGYISGTSESDVLGTYRVTDGNLVTEDIVDPFSVSSEVGGVRATLGAKLKLAFFRFNADYTFAEFDSFSVGVNFGFR